MQLLRKKGMLDSNRVLFLPVDAISPNPDQPRRVFSQHELEELAASIRALGLLQPLTVRRGEQGWELVAGERRLRAAKLAGLTEVPCLSLQIDSQRSSLLALVENLQRKDLDFWEEALALDRLISTYHLSQEEAARRIGKSQSAVANKLRLLKLPCAVLERLRDAGATERHARALLPLGRGRHRAPRPGPAPPGRPGPPDPGGGYYFKGEAHRGPDRGPGGPAPPPRPSCSPCPAAPPGLCGEGRAAVSQLPEPGDGPYALGGGGRPVQPGGPGGRDFVDHPYSPPGPGACFT